MEHFFIITGGPGSGKTNLIEELTKRGFFCVEEASRKIIRNEMTLLGDALPWKNIALYTEKLFIQSIDSYNEALKIEEKVIIFDRGILDYINYAYRFQVKMSNEWHDRANALVYNKKVFIILPWPEIYCTDTERKQSFEESVVIYHALVQAYSTFGYGLIELPKMAVEKRADFLINHLTRILFV